jgi:HlyD family secretion protein
MTPIPPVFYTRRSKTCFLAGLVVSFVSVVSFSSFFNLALADTKVNAPTKAQAALTVQITQPTWQTWPLTLVANGNVEAWQEATVSAYLMGLAVTRIYADVGQTVRKGQILAQLDESSIEIDLAQAQAQLATAQAAFELAALNAKRARDLKNSGVMTAQQIDQLIVNERSTQAQVQVAQAAVLAQKLRLEKTAVLAPDGGLITARMATMGLVPGTGMTGAELFRLIRQNRLEWRAEVTPEQTTHVRPGQSATVTLPSGQTISGRVRLIGPTVDSRNRVAMVYVDVFLPKKTTSSPVWQTGVLAKGVIKVSQSPAWVVPQSAIVIRDGQSGLFVVDDQQVVHHKKIETGRTQGGFIEITQGLLPQKKGESLYRIVKNGAAFLKEGDQVSVVGS